MTKARIAKRIVAIATTMLMLALMVMPAAAAGTGKVTVTKYAGTSIAGALPNTTGEQVPAASIPAGFTALPGAGFTMYHLPDNDVTDVINAATGGVTFVSHTVNANVTPPTVTWTLSDTSTHTVAAVAVAWGAEKITDASGVAIFDGGTPSGVIDDGWYVLVETTTPAGHIEATPSLIMMPMTDNDGDPVRDVYVYPKNITSTGIANKDVDGALKPVSKGDQMHFELKSLFSSASVGSVTDLRATTAPSANPADYGSAVIEERFSLYFEQVGADTDIRVNWLDGTGNLLPGALTQNTHYTITRTPATATDGEVIAVALTVAGIDAAIAANAPGFGFRLEAEYTGAPTAGVGTAAPVINTMASIMTAPLVTPQPPIIDPIFVPTISVTGTKVDENNAPLAGATFKIATVAVNPQPSDFVKDASNNDLVVTTDSTGVFSFSNLPNYSNTTGATYYLHETVTPAGYNGAVVQSVIWANKADHQIAVPTDFDASGNWAENINLVKLVTVQNTLIGTTPPHSPGFSLPLTGGAGTLLFTAIGIIVMLGATGAYLHGKKRNLEK
jgi:Cna protein B-type domain./Gram positive anchor.